MMANRRLLISYAHPDDEAFGLGGLITRYVAEGVDVSLICATNGDVGTVAPEFLNGYSSVAELRLAELDCAAAKLRLKQVYKLGFKDSGMMGSPTCADPTCLWQAPQEQVTRRVVEVLREVRPQVVITFNKYGGYGHPDHIAIQRATTEAFMLAGDPTYLTDGQTPYAPAKLYYSGIPTFQLRLGIWRVRMQGKDPRRLGRNGDIDILKILENVEPAHAWVDIRAYHDAWNDASLCHASQLGGGTPRIPMSVRRWLLPRQGFTRVFPPPQPGLREADLFAGVPLDVPTPTP
jgi:N-acetyl-1-D-myo-inositol-2-amino-2-deoxy-alpha-D-glucopyranoside deacetylase/mycothiol S-conjugate amidase